MPRFAILDHDWPVRHWDLLLEDGAACLTWRLAAPPEAPGTIAATAAAPHRLAYLDYEGPVSGDRGTVVQWDAGTYERVAPQSGPEAGTSPPGSALRVVLIGRRVRGAAALEPVGPGDAWTFRLE